MRRLSVVFGIGLAGILWGTVSPADEPQLLSPESLMAELSGQITTLQFDASGVDVPPGGHIQGLQLLHDVKRQRYLLFVSHDSRSLAYVVVVAFPETLDRPGEVLHVQHLADGELRHAGGIQIHDGILAVGVEDNRSKDRSVVQFWDVTDPVRWQSLKHLTISRQGTPKDKTAGAVALTTYQGKLLAAVANWDSRDIDFYQATDTDATRGSCRLRDMGRWSLRQADRSDWDPDERYGSYQALNFFAGASKDELFLAGFWSSRQSDHEADLFTVNLSDGDAPELQKLSRAVCNLQNGCRFQYGGGFSFAGGRFRLLASERSLTPDTHLNLVE